MGSYTVITLETVEFLKTYMTNTVGGED